MTAVQDRDRAKPLCIALMTESVWLGGAEMVVLQLAQELKARGHDVFGVFPVERDGFLKDEFSARGIEWETYHLRRAIDYTMLTDMAQTLHRRGAEAVHSHEFTMSVYGTAAAKKLRVPHVITWHANQGTMQRFRNRVALRWAFRNSKATVAVSEDTRRQLESTLGLRSGLVQVIPNGIPVPNGNPEAPRRELGVAAGEILILAVGNLVPRKGHMVLLEALHRLQMQGLDVPWKLAIAGWGPEQEPLEAKIKSAGWEDRVRLLGLRSDIADLQAAADIFVMPSLWEGLPLAILEAMFAGSAIIASNISGIPEAIKHGQNGLLAPAGDVKALADSLRQLLTDPLQRERLGSAAREHACRHFTIDVVARAYEQLYRGDSLSRIG